ncbi:MULTISPECIES: LytR/AlgR family response regulator transcription factor [Marinifilum]|jgi:DNA-binding LytR/AlgR family response regulator|uniref:LytR/AlgR family response regulator transcription factor n=1 Tax=Marinifilum TaxID=866673 RepID=UPI0022763D7C|nr:MULTISPECIES: LytTR family DNA-binding domain-containing protein [Marinifilum]MCY1635607.1 LytTR family DNA-binding domain-containing protein [Marinifilum sp. D737]
MKLKCLIIDDEPLAQRVLEKYVSELSSLELKGKCSDAIEAMEVLQQESVDLIFLDINMPRLSGINFLKSYKNPPMVIITTAYTEYALESYELNVLDYLKKPFSFERFLQAVQKAEEKVKALAEPQETTKDELEYIFVKANKKTININLDSIQYVEALGDYVKIFTNEGHVVTYQSLKGIERLLPSAKFYRIHKSYIVALAKIKSIEGNMVHMDKGTIPIGNNYKQGFFQRIHPV